LCRSRYPSIRETCFGEEAVVGAFQADRVEQVGFEQDALHVGEHPGVFSLAELVAGPGDVAAPVAVGDEPGTAWRVGSYHSNPPGPMVGPEPVLADGVDEPPGRCGPT